LNVNKRLIVVGIFLGIAITIAFFMGCPSVEINEITGGWLCRSFDLSR